MELSELVALLPSVDRTVAIVVLALWALVRLASLASRSSAGRGVIRGRHRVEDTTRPSSQAPVD